jgi:hypothetical protein
MHSLTALARLRNTGAYEPPNIGTLHSNLGFSITTSVRADTFSFSFQGSYFPAPARFTAAEVGHIDSDGVSFSPADGNDVEVIDFWDVDEPAKGFDIPQFDSVSVTESSLVPEPGSLALFGIGIMGVADAVRRQLAV